MFLEFNILHAQKRNTFWAQLFQKTAESLKDVSKNQQIRVKQ